MKPTTPKDRAKRPCRWARIATFVAAISILLVAPVARSEIDGLSYSLSPGAEYIFWPRDVRLENGALYGGHLGFEFGRLVALQGYFHSNPRLRTEFQPIAPGIPPVDQDIRLRQFGGEVRVNLRRGRITPFVRGGGGVLRFDPEHGESLDRIGLRLGAGAELGIGSRLRAVLSFQDNLFGLERGLLAPPQPEENGAARLADGTPEESEIRSHLAVGAALSLRIGGDATDGETEIDRAMRARYQAGLRGASWPIELFAGSLHYAAGPDLPNQDLVGVRTGLDFGPYLGLRGFYWRGVRKGFDATDTIQAFGAEMIFSLNAGRGLIPYLAGGVGYLDGLGQARRDRDREIGDEPCLIAGGGIRLPFSRRIRVDLSARDFVLSGKTFDAPSTPEDLSSNWLYSAALSFSIGGAGDAMPTTPPRPGPTGPQPWEDGRSVWSVEGLSAGADSIHIATHGVPGDSLRSFPGRISRYSGDRLIGLPVPLEGEVYIRYGPPGAIRLESRSIVGRDSLAITVRGEGGGRSFAYGADLRPQESDPLVVRPRLSEETVTREEIRRMIREELAATRAPLPAAETRSEQVRPGALHPGSVQTGGASADAITRSELALMLRGMKQEILDGIEAGIGARAQAPRDAADLPPPAPAAAAPVTLPWSDDTTGDRDSPAATRPAVDEGESIGRSLSGHTLLQTQRILFASASDTLLESSHEVLGAVASVMRDNPELRLRIEGHTDARGSARLNHALSDARARRVRTELIERYGIEPGRLEAIGLGESQPISPGSSPTEQALNRRVVFRAIASSDAAPTDGPSPTSR